MPVHFVFVPLILAWGLSSAMASDFAQHEHSAAWQSHPVFGEASFDTFERLPGNPIHRGAPPYNWPVNGFFFADPNSDSWYVYIGHYLENYGLNDSQPSMCTVFRSSDQGRTWTEIGPIFGPESFFFEGEVSPLFHAPDVAVTYSEGRYHLCFDWTTKNTTWANAASPPADANSGVGYAWSDKPEGPFHIEPRPIATTRDQEPLLGKYRRLYASSLIKRKNDWLVLTLTDSGRYFGWAQLGMTAEKPEGPYTNPELLLHPEADRFHPPLLEFFPAFVHDGYVYSPTTSVALNRNVQAMFRAPIETAHQAESWELHQFGSIWHAAPVENEWHGIWGQTLSGSIASDGTFIVMFPSRDKDGRGTINLAKRTWATRHRRSGFHVSAHEGPSLVLLRQSGPAKSISFSFDKQNDYFTGIGIVWDLSSPLGPNEPRSNAVVSDHRHWYANELKLTNGAWSLLEHRQGTKTLTASGNAGLDEKVHGAIQWRADGVAEIMLNGERCWTGPAANGPGIFAIQVEPHTWAAFTKFEIEGSSPASTLVFDSTEGLLGAAQSMEHWDKQSSDQFRFGFGHISKSADASAKWNIEGHAFRLYAPRGPAFGNASVYVDGALAGAVDFASTTPVVSSLVFEHHLEHGRHAVSLRGITGRVPVDCVEVDARF